MQRKMKPLKSKKPSSKNIPTKALDLSTPVLKDKLGDDFYNINIMKEMVDVERKFCTDIKKMLGEVTTDIKKFVENKDVQLSAWVDMRLSSANET